MTDLLRNDLTTDTPGDEIAVWVDGDYTDAENLAPIKAENVTFLPGTRVVFVEDHEMYPGESGTVKAVGQGQGTYSGDTYDVLPDGCSDTERVALEDIEAE